MKLVIDFFTGMNAIGIFTCQMLFRWIILSNKVRNQKNPLLQRRRCGSLSKNVGNALHPISNKIWWSSATSSSIFSVFLQLRTPCTIVTNCCTSLLFCLRLIKFHIFKMVVENVLLFPLKIFMDQSLVLPYNLHTLSVTI